MNNDNNELYQLKKKHIEDILDGCHTSNCEEINYDKTLFKGKEERYEMMNTNEKNAFNFIDTYLKEQKESEPIDQMIAGLELIEDNNIEDVHMNSSSVPKEEFKPVYVPQSDTMNVDANVKKVNTVEETLYTENTDNKRHMDEDIDNTRFKKVNKNVKKINRE
jgi:hypothetical protein